MLLFLMLQAAAPAMPPIPTDWAALAPLPFARAPQVTQPMNQFVAGEIAAGRCIKPKPADGHYIVHVDIAVLLGPDGNVRKTLPRAIDCPTVEQYSIGLLQSFARGNLQPRTGATADQWFRATIVYDWGA
jgi:hypothetical protein